MCLKETKSEKDVVRQGLRKISACYHLQLVKAEKRPGAKEGALVMVVPIEVDGEEVWLTKFLLPLA